jgi:hypothetical protein
MPERGASGARGEPKASEAAGAGCAGAVHGRARFWAGRALVLAGAVAIGLLLQHVLAQRLDAIQALSASNVVRARAELATLLRVSGSGVFGLTAATGLAMLLACRRALVIGRFPPPGVWSWGSRRTLEGAQAAVAARLGLVLAALLMLCSLAGGWLMWWMAARLLACPAP